MTLYKASELAFDFGEIATTRPRRFGGKGAMTASERFLEDFAQGRRKLASGCGPAAQNPILLAYNANSPLEDLVESDIGPRLALFHYEAAPAEPPEDRPTRADVDRLAYLVIGADEAATVAHFESVRARGYSYPTLLAHFVAPAAHRLGELWKEDECSFFDVTIGVGRLQAFMDRIAEPEAISAMADPSRRALLVALPGEAHLLGLRIIAKLLEANGWDVTLEEQLPGEHNARTAAREWFGVVGMTLSSAESAPLAARTVAMIRNASLNPRVAVIVSGNALIRHPELALQIGADALGFDASAAVVLGTHLLTRQLATQ